MEAEEHYMPVISMALINIIVSAIIIICCKFCLCTMLEHKVDSK